MEATVHRVCTLCEANCGLTFHVDGERILSVRPDPEDSFSRGFACPKGIAIAKVHDDPDRLRQPVRRNARGGFDPIPWPEALDEAAAGLRRVRERHGKDAVAVYWGNPVIHNHGALMVRFALNAALGTRNVFGAGSQDVSPRFATSYHLYGSSLVVPIPDIDRTQWFLCVGANPVISNGSVMTAPDVRARLRAIRERGGKVIVVDPRRSETAREADEHVPIRPGMDAPLLLAMAAVVVREGAAPIARIRAETTGWDEVERRLRDLGLDACARASGVPIATIVRLAREMAASVSVAYSRIGVCNARFGTLATYATDLLNVVTGRLGAEGGALFPTPALDAVRLVKLSGDGHARWRTRVRGLPETLGELPSAAFAEEIETPGEGQVHALLTFAGNPVLSIPNGRRLDAALERLDFQVAIDLYVNETTRHADLILPPAWTLAEEHWDLLFPLLSVRNVVRRSPPVVPRREGELHDWEILLGLSRRLGGGPTGVPAMDRLLNLGERLGHRWTPRPMLSFLLRTGAYGDKYLPWRRGLTLRDVEAAPRGIDLGPLRTGVAHRLQHRDRRVHLAPAPLAAAWDALGPALQEPAREDRLLLIGRREQRTNNSWMHNVASLVSGAERCLLYLHPDDAAARGIADREIVIMESRVHRGEVRVRLTDDIARGVVSLPHGWGHAPSAPWQSVAGRAPGVSANDWTDEGDVEGVVGQSILNGVPVQVYRRSETRAAAAG